MKTIALCAGCGAVAFLAMSYQGASPGPVGEAAVAGRAAGGGGGRREKSAGRPGHG